MVVRDELNAFYLQNQESLENSWQEKIQHISCADSHEHLTYIVNSEKAFWEFVEDCFDLKNGY